MSVLIIQFWEHLVRRRQSHNYSSGLEAWGRRNIFTVATNSLFMNIIKFQWNLLWRKDRSHSNQSLFSTAGRNILLLCLSISVITCAVVSSLQLTVSYLSDTDRLVLQYLKLNVGV